MRAAFVIIATVMCAACQPEPEKKPSLHDQRRAVLNKIAEKCGLPWAVFELSGDDQLGFNLDPNSSYASVDCALREVKESKIPFKLGFVGNEAYVGNAE